MLYVLYFKKIIFQFPVLSCEVVWDGTSVSEAMGHVSKIS